jgi:hypothetical protein
MKKYLSDNDLIFATMSPKEAMEWTGGKDKEKIKHLREVKHKARLQEAENAKQKARKETALERIERITWEHGENPKRPKHLDNKKIYSFENSFKKNHPNINDKPTKAAAAVSYMKKPTPPVVDIKELSNDLDTYIALKEADKNEIYEKKLKVMLNAKEKDPDADKGIASIFGGYPKKYI